MMSSKKLINFPDKVVDEALAGLISVYPGLKLLQDHRVIVISDIDKVWAKRKVIN